MIAPIKKREEFPSLTANPVFYRTYSRNFNGTRETLQDVCVRVVDCLTELGKLTEEETALLYRNMRSLKSIPAGRILWVAGTEWFKKPENFYGGYNCSNDNVMDWKAFGLMMDKAMQGTGTGASLEPKYIEQLPTIKNHLDIMITCLPGEDEWRQDDLKHQTYTTVHSTRGFRLLTVGDSRKGWVNAYLYLLELASEDVEVNQPIQVNIDLSHVRPKGEKLKGFGGVANPTKLPELFPKVARILNGAVGRKLNSVECCLLIDEAALVVVAGNIRRSAGMRQFDTSDSLAVAAKENLWQQDKQGNWKIDPKRDALRMANHTLVFHHKPTREECVESVRKQYYSGEGAIQWAGEAVARANCDLLNTEGRKKTFLEKYQQGEAIAVYYLAGLHYLEKGKAMSTEELEHRVGRYKLNPCGLSNDLAA